MLKMSVDDYTTGVALLHATLPQRPTRAERRATDPHVRFRRTEFAVEACYHAACERRDTTDEQRAICKACRPLDLGCTRYLDFMPGGSKAVK